MATAILDRPIIAKILTHRGLGPLPHQGAARSMIEPVQHRPVQQGRVHRLCEEVIAVRRLLRIHEEDWPQRRVENKDRTGRLRSKHWLASAQPVLHHGEGKGRLENTIREPS